MLRDLIEDARYGVRVLRARPGHLAVAVLTLALGIAANTTVFGWIDAVLLNPLPGVADGGRLAVLETVSPTGEFSTTSYRDYRDYRDSLTQVSGVAASLFNAFNIGADDSPRRIWGEYVSGNYFAVLGVAPVRGRAFLPEEYGDKPGAYPVAIISHKLWLSAFGGNPKAVGGRIRINRNELTIVGIAPEKFRGAVPGLDLELWVPMTMAPQLNGQSVEGLLSSRTQRHMWVTARLKPGVTVEQAEQEVVARARRIAEAEPRTSAGFSAALMPVWKGHIGAQGILLRPLSTLMAVCVLVFLIVGANVANLQLARLTARRREFSMRLALGASRARLARQLLTESLILAAMGTAAGMLLSLWLEQGLVILFPPSNLPLVIGIPRDGMVLGVTILLCVGAAILSGLAPAIHCARGSLNEALKEGGRSGTSGTATHRTRRLLVVGEVALALIALIGTGLFVRSFVNARSLDTGFDPTRVLMAQYHLDTFAASRDQRAQFCLQLRDRLAAMAGIAAVGYSDEIPLSLGTPPRSELQVEGYVPATGESMRVQSATISEHYHEALGIPVIEGRDFSARDDEKTEFVAIVNQTFARVYYAGQSPIGRIVHRGSRAFRIVGMVRDSKYRQMTEPATPHFFTDYRQDHGGEFWVAFFIRTAGPPANAVARVRHEAAQVNPNAAVTEVISYEEYIGGALYPQRVAATLLSVLGTVALLLAAVGMYGVLAYSVSERTHEFGIRMALGAQAGDVIAMVMGQGMRLAGLGIAVGALAAFAASRLVVGMLVGTSASDPLVYSSAVAFLALVGLAASYVPAMRATRVDPTVALREQ